MDLGKVFPSKVETPARRTQRALSKTRSIESLVKKAKSARAIPYETFKEIHSDHELQSVPLLGPMPKSAGDTCEIDVIENDKLGPILEDWCAGFPVVVGYRLGLFQTMAGKNPGTAADIAKAAGLKERMTREWLNCMVAASVVNVDATGTLYSLAPYQNMSLQTTEYSLFLVSDAALELSHVFTDIENCCKKEGPEFIPSDKYSRFESILRKMNEIAYRTTTADNVIPLLPKEIQKKLAEGCDCLDIGCNDGSLSRVYAQRYSKSTFYGVDCDPKAVEMAQQKAKEEQLTNVQFACGDVIYNKLFGGKKYNWITVCKCLHDCAEPAATLTAIRSLLKPGGCFSVIEANGHSNPYDNADNMHAAMLYSFSLFYCIPKTRAYKKNEDIYGILWGKEKIKSALEKAKFNVVAIKDLGNLDCHFLCTPMA